MSQPRLYDQASDPRNDMGKEAFEADLDRILGPEPDLTPSVPEPAPVAIDQAHYKDQEAWTDYARQAEANKAKGEIAVEATVTPPVQVQPTRHKPHFA